MFWVCCKLKRFLHEDRIKDLNLSEWESVHLATDFVMLVKSCREENENIVFRRDLQMDNVTTYEATEFSIVECHCIEGLRNRKRKIIMDIFFRLVFAKSVDARLRVLGRESSTSNVSFN